MIKAAGDVFLAQALLSLIRPIVLHYQSAILKQGQWPIAGHWNEPQQAQGPVLDPASAFLMNEADSAQYFELCHYERDRLGLRVSRPGNCPLLEAQENLRQAKRRLVTLMEPVTGITCDKLIENSLQYYDEYVEMTLRLFAPHINAKDILSGLKPLNAAG